MDIRSTEFFDGHDYAYNEENELYDESNCSHKRSICVEQRTIFPSERHNHPLFQDVAIEPTLKNKAKFIKQSPLTNGVPNKPLFVPRTNIYSTKNVEYIVELIGKSLECFPETLTYIFDRDLYKVSIMPSKTLTSTNLLILQWSAVIIIRSAKCSLEINLYSSGDAQSSVIVAANKVMVGNTLNSNLIQS